MPKALHGTSQVFAYIFAIARAVYGERLSQITFDEIHRTIRKVAIAMQTTREIEAGKRYKDYRKMAQERTFMRAAADKTVSAMILWGFLKRPAPRDRGKKERWYYIEPELYSLGETLSQNRLRRAGLMVFDRILDSERDSAFTPDLLVRIRDSRAISEEKLSEYNLPTDGVFTNTPSLVRNYLKVGQVDFRMITYWCKELNLLNEFNPRILDIKSPHEVFLTMWLASTNELSSFYNRVVVGDPEIRSFGDLNCARLLELIKAVRAENNHLVPLSGSQFEASENQSIIRSVEAPYTSELIVVGEKSKFRGLISGELEGFKNIYLLTSRHISNETFASTLKNHYQTLRTKWKTPYVWISPLRALCCRTLMIGDEDFDDMLTSLYKANPEAMEFSKAATRIFRTRVRLFEKPFKLYGQPFRMIRLVEQT